MGSDPGRTCICGSSEHAPFLDCPQSRAQYAESLESRLREAEAERDKIDAAFKRWREDARRIQAAAEGEKLQAEARVERLEAELREARAIIRDFCEYSLPAPPSVVSLQALTDRARGVLEKGTGPAERNA